MRIETPWVRRQRQKIESRPGCAGAREYARKSKLIIEEWGRILKRVAQQGMFIQRDYSYILGMLQEHTKRVPPPAAVDLHDALTRMSDDVRDGVRELDPLGSQDPQEVQRIVLGAAAQLEPEGEVIRSYSKLYDACFYD